MIDLFYAGPDAPEEDLEAMEFRYYEPNEFADPVYLICRGGQYYGKIRVSNGAWYTELCSDYAYPRGFRKAVVAKLHELNNALEERKAFLWGL